MRGARVTTDDNLGDERPDHQKHNTERGVNNSNGHGTPAIKRNVAIKARGVNFTSGFANARVDVDWAQRSKIGSRCDDAP